MDSENWKSHLSKLLWESHHSGKQHSKPILECISGSWYRLFSLTSFHFTGLISLLTCDLKELLQGSLVWGQETREVASHPPAGSK